MLAHKNTVRLLAAGLFAVALSGCQTMQSAMFWRDKEPQQAEVPPPRPGVERPVADALSQDPKPARPQLVEVPDPQVMVGWEDRRMQRLAGAPSLDRREDRARFWNYSTEACVLYVILNEDQNGVMRVTHMDTLWHDPDAAPPGAETKGCLQIVASEHAARSGGL